MANTTDMTCLAEGLVVPANSDLTGLNLNEIVVGPTGCGKSYSNAYSRLVHTYDASVVVPITKKAIKVKFAKMFKERGYQVIDLDFAHPENCKVGYDPLDFVHSDEDVIHLASNVMGSGPNMSLHDKSDPFWKESSTSEHAAIIALIRLNAKVSGKKASYADVIELQRTLKCEGNKTNLDTLFERAERQYPGNHATELWRTLKDAPSRTLNCIMSTADTAVDKIFTENIVNMMKKENRVSFKELGNKKTAIFITTSPMNKTLQNYINIFYADLFRELFEEAEKNEDSRLKVPVHIICDDFACGSRINGFEDYISIFRAAGISVTMLLQSESQLGSMYGEAAADTIINNCDTYVYMGGMDIKTCEHISRRINMPLNKVMSLPKEKVFVFRRGDEPYVSRRYQILDDELYKQVVAEESAYNEL